MKEFYKRAVTVCFTQMSSKKEIYICDKKAVEVTQKEYKQMEILTIFWCRGYKRIIKR